MICFLNNIFYNDHEYSGHWFPGCQDMVCVYVDEALQRNTL